MVYCNSFLNYLSIFSCMENRLQSCTYAFFLSNDAVRRGFISRSILSLSLFLFLFLPLSSGANSCVTQQAEVHLLWMNSLRLRCDTQQDFFFRRVSVSPYISCLWWFFWFMDDLTSARLRSLAGARGSVHRWTSHSHLVQTACAPQVFFRLSLLF